jgi:hypothetical protein
MWLESPDLGTGRVIRSGEPIAGYGPRDALDSPPFLAFYQRPVQESNLWPTA